MRFSLIQASDNLLLAVFKVLSRISHDGKGTPTRLDGHAIFPGAPTVSADFFPSLSQNVRPEDAVIERMKPSVSAPFGRQV